MRRVPWLALLVVAVSLPCPLAAQDTAAILARVQRPTLAYGRAVSLGPLRLKAGTAELEIKQGILVPAEGGGERPAELVFHGNAILRMVPPDAIEASQLELFTDQPSLEEEIEAAVFVLTQDGAVDALLGKAAAGDLAAETKSQTDALFAEWLASPERKLLEVDTALLGDALGEAVVEGYFVGWMRGVELGKFLYVYEPSASEQVSLGQFVQLELTEKEKRKARKKLHREQQEGRLLGVEVEDYGTFNTWVSCSQRDAKGQIRPGMPSFEPKHYEIDVTLGRGGLDLAGKARLHLVSTSGHGRIARITLNPDLRVGAVRSGGGEALFFHQTGGSLAVVLPAAPGKGETTIVEIEYRGDLIDKFEGRTFLLRDTQSWYPHAGEIDLATYDVTFHWPDNLELAAAGSLVEEGKEAGGLRRERRKLDIPTMMFGFEVGKFRELKKQAGHVEISLLIDSSAVSYLKWDQQTLIDTLAEAILYFESVFGPYPLDRLVAVTAPRAFSQSMLGFITLSSIMMFDEEGLGALLFGLEDPRTVIAHEVAHQWWGHKVGMRSYREEWISEAIASYSAVHFARTKLWPEKQSVIGPTTGWQADLLATTGEGRPLESLGPLVVGRRLDSSLSGDAYTPIVYKKGAVVLDMLSRFFGEENFLRLLSAAAGEINHRAVSTESFLALLGKLSGSSLDSFARQFIYGTGLPEIYYDYAIAPEGEEWVIRLTARQQSPLTFRYELVEQDGRLDVRRQVKEQVAVESSAVAVPVRILAFDPTRPPPKGQKVKKGEEAPNVTLGTNRLLKGAETALELRVQHEPKKVILDPDFAVFGRFFDQRTRPKRMLYYRASDRLAMGDLAGADQGLTEARAAAAVNDAEDSRKDAELEGRLFDAWIEIARARLELERARPADAKQALARAEGLLDRSVRDYVEPGLRFMEAKVELAEGRPQVAYEILKKAFYRRGRITAGPEGTLLLAITARELEDEKLLAAARKRAEKQGVDVALLGPPPGR